MKIEIHKCHGSGNDFILIDEMNNRYDFTDSARERLAAFLCRRDIVGSEGMLFYQESEVADCRMRMFNPDGSEAEMCGNGIRCLARYCRGDKNISAIEVETMKALLTVNPVEDILPGVVTYETEISPISFAPESLPMKIEGDRFIDSLVPGLDSKRKFTALTVPNPHIVTFVEELDEEEVEVVGGRANDIETFPRGVNVSFCRLLGGNDIYVVTYERGVGITYSCGTGMSATTFAACLLDHFKFGTLVSVYNRGGFVGCRAVDAGSTRKVMLSGNATFVYKSTIDIDLDDLKTMEQSERIDNSQEVRDYENVVQKALTLLKKYHITS